VIGEVVPLSQGPLLVNEDGTKEDLLPPPVDLFWEAFGKPWPKRIPADFT